MTQTVINVMKKQFWDHSTKPSVFVEITDGVETYRGPFSGAMHNTEIEDLTNNLKNYNLWRRGENDEQPCPKDIGVWIDEICNRVDDQNAKVIELQDMIEKLVEQGLGLMDENRFLKKKLRSLKIKL